MTIPFIGAVPEPRPRIVQVPLDRPWAWLLAGFQDMLAAPVLSFSYGLALAAVGWLAIALAMLFDLPYLLLPLTAGFFFMGPFVAVGLYEISRRLQKGFVVEPTDVVFAWRRNAGQIGLMGLILLLIHLAWMRIAQLLFALFAIGEIRSWDRFFDVALNASQSLPFVAVGTVIGAGLAALTFAIGGLSIPYLLDRPRANVFEAIGVSLSALRRNPKPMLLWAALIVVFTAHGLVPAFLGLIVVLPVVAHATWHAYRDIVRFDDR